MKIVSATEMARLDSEAIQGRGIPGEQLMERAGKGVFDCVNEIIRERNLPPYVVLFAGKGNNGGDAFVTARYLEKTGTRTTTIVLTDETSLKGDAQLNCTRLKNSGSEIVFAASTGELQPVRRQLADCGLIVDGILGTGTRGTVTGFFAEVIDLINSSGKPVISIDIPSGIDGNDGAVAGPCIDAHATVTLALPKTGLFRGQSLNFTGKVSVVDIGLPPDIIEKAESPAELITRDDVRFLLPRRRRISHKGDYGRIMALCGSRGYTGAACLVTQAAMRCGTGLSYLLIPESLNASMEAKLTEVITLPVPETPEGSPSHEGLGYILDRLRQCDAAVIGTGLSTHPETAALVKGILHRVSVPVVVDADGLNCIVDGPDLLRRYEAPCIITPHVGEFSRLAKIPSETVLADLWGCAARYAREHEIVVVLKSAQTVIAAPEGKTYVNIAGNAGMASAGVGDVLTGIITSLLGQGLDALDAARLGVFLHGTAGDLAADAVTQSSLIASDLIDTLPLAIASLEPRG